MKKFVDFFKNMRNIIKILQCVSECLTAIAEIYNKYFPAEEKKKDDKTGVEIK